MAVGSLSNGPREYPPKGPPYELTSAQIQQPRRHGGRRGREEYTPPTHTRLGIFISFTPLCQSTRSNTHPYHLRSLGQSKHVQAGQLMLGLCVPLSRTSYIRVTIRSMIPLLFLIKTSQRASHYPPTNNFHHFAQQSWASPPPIRLLWSSTGMPPSKFWYPPVSPTIALRLKPPNPQNTRAMQHVAELIAQNSTAPTGMPMAGHPTPTHTSPATKPVGGPLATR
jgi:hypothetical protein